MSGLTDVQARLIDEATAAAGASSLSDIQHVVILMQENRSFDRYFARGRTRVKVSNSV